MSDPYTDPDFPTAALITIDTQCDLLDGGALEIAGTSAALGPMRVLVEAFRDAGRPIVHIVRLYRADGANVDPCRRKEVEEGGHVLTPGTRCRLGPLRAGLTGVGRHRCPSARFRGRSRVAVMEPKEFS